MSWIALCIALAAMPLALLHRSFATALTVVALALVAADMTRGNHPHVRKVAAVAVGLAVVVTSVSVAAISAPDPTDVPDAEPYQRAGKTREVLLPLEVRTMPVRGILLLDLEDGEDEIYKGFEPQSVEQGSGKGMRIIGYRHDGFVDVYDDLALPAETNPRFEVTGKGLHKYRHVDLGEPVLERDEQGRVRARAEFVDVIGRKVSIDVEERSERKSRPFSLIAPIGATARNPQYFPLFMANEFDFLRTADARLEVHIAGEAKKVLNFPMGFPLQGQPRSVAKCSLSTEIIEVFPVLNALRIVTTDPGTDRFVDGDVTYLFSENALERIKVHDHEIVFEPALSVSAQQSGQWRINSHLGRGGVEGRYTTTANGDTADLRLTIHDVQLPNHRDLGVATLVRLLGFFEQWPKHYEYHATINLHTAVQESEWVNREPI